jgi:hypothetical protein
MLDEIRAKRDAIYEIARRHKAERLWVFGSCARKEERQDSDVDFLVQFAPHTNAFDYVRLQDALSVILNRKTDIVDESVLENEPRLSREVLRERIAV